MVVVGVEQNLRRGRINRIFLCFKNHFNANLSLHRIGVYGIHVEVALVNAVTEVLQIK